MGIYAENETWIGICSQGRGGGVKKRRSSTPGCSLTACTHSGIGAMAAVAVSADAELVCKDNRLADFLVSEGGDITGVAEEKITRIPVAHL